MKARGEALGDLARPDPARAGILLHGSDPARVAIARRALVAELVGPEGAAEMRLARVAPDAIRREHSALNDAVAARSFFPGHRVVLVEDATDALADPILEALASWRRGDAELVVTAAGLAARSALRRGFEGARNAVAVALHADPPGPRAIEAALSRAGLKGPDPAALAALDHLGRDLDAGEFAGLLDKLALYMSGEAGPVALADVEAVAPLAGEADLDRVLDLVAEGEAGALRPQMQRLAAQGGQPTTMVIGAGRYFRALHAAAVAADAEAALSRLRPPVFGARRSRMAAQARRLGRGRLERALALIFETDLALRSSRPVPGHALVERTFVRLAMLARAP